MRVRRAWRSEYIALYWRDIDRFGSMLVLYLCLRCLCGNVKGHVGDLLLVGPGTAAQYFSYNYLHSSVPSDSSR